MRDPYSVLGVDRNASLDEIKKAYRTLSRKYHPDANINNPNKAQAEEKFKEVQAAYDQIIKARENGTSGYDYDDRADYSSNGGFNGNPFGGFGGFGPGGFGPFGGFNGYTGSRSTSDPETQRLSAAMDYISHGYYKEAMNVLSDIDNHNARWYYLHALANNGLGNNINARSDAKMAHELEPNNPEYAQFASALENGTTWYYNEGQRYGGNIYRVDDCTSCCSKLICLNCLCGGCC